MAIEISEIIYSDFTLLQNKVVVKDYSTIGEDETCNFKIPVFAYPSDTTDKYRNDFTAPLFMGTNRYNSGVFYLEELVCDTWTEIATLNDSTFGTYYNSFTGLSSWVGFKLDWWKVYNSEGVGCYRIRLEYNDILEATTKIEYSYRYTLNLFNANLADKTTKIEYKINGGKIGSTQSDGVVNYKSNTWVREIRLPNSFFGFDSSEFTREFTRYKNGKEEWIQDEQVETLRFNAKRLPYPLHRELKITALQSGEIYMSDYNLGNVTTYNRKQVIPSSNYEPNWNLYNEYASVELTFNPAINNLRRKRC